MLISTSILLCATAVRALVVLGPPASHYRYYHYRRADIYNFTARFHDAANASNERLVAVTDEVVQRNLTQLGMDDFLRASLDDIWMRDLFITQLSPDRAVSFAYNPAYLSPLTIQFIDESRRALINATWPSASGLVHDLNLVLDGGNIVWEPSTRRAVLTERVLLDNPWLVGRTSLSQSGRLPGPNPLNGLPNAAPYADALPIDASMVQTGTAAITALLSTALGGAAVTVALVPEEPGVPRLGHIDGICNWLNPSTLALSSFANATVYAQYEGRLRAAFGSAVTIVPFPYHPVDETWIDGFESSKGIYVNFARTPHALYLPTFGIPADADALARARAHADVPTVPVEASAVAIMGGSVRCLSTVLWGAVADAVVAHLVPPTVAATPSLNAGPIVGVAVGGAALLVLLTGVGLARAAARRGAKHAASEQKEPVQ